MEPLTDIIQRCHHRHQKTASTAKDGGNTCDAWQRISTSIYGLLRAQVPRAAGRLRTSENFFYADRTRT